MEKEYTEEQKKEIKELINIKNNEKRCKNERNRIYGIAARSN